MALFGGLLEGKPLSHGLLARLLNRNGDPREDEMQGGYPAPKAEMPPPAEQPPEGSIDPRFLEMLARSPNAGEPKKGLGRILGDDFGEKLARAAAFANDDYRGAAQISRAIADNRGNRQAQQSAYDQALKVASLPGMNEREFAAYLANPEQWGSHMADALSSHQAAANVGQTETRVFGDPTNGGHVYQPTRLIENGVDQLRYDPTTGKVDTAVQGMTDGEQYARSLGVDPGSSGWNTAVRDEMLRGSGPTSHDLDMTMERARQEGRLNLRQTPSPARIKSPFAGSPKPTARRSPRPTATAPDGRKLEWNGKAWRPVR